MIKMKYLDLLFHVDRNIGQDLKQHMLSTLFLLIIGSQTHVSKIPGNIWGRVCAKRLQSCGSFKVGGWELYSVFVEAG